MAGDRTVRATGSPAARRKLPLGTEVTVASLGNGRSVTLTIYDRDLYVDGHVIDLSHRAAKKLGMVEQGLARLRIVATGQQLEMADAGVGD